MASCCDRRRPCPATDRPQDGTPTTADRANPAQCDREPKLRTAATPEPAWSRPIGRPTLVHAWISTDELDDQSNVLAAFAYDRRPPHALNLLDQLLGYPEKKKEPCDRKPDPRSVARPRR
jgi:hypothetical protein